MYVAAAVAAAPRLLLRSLGAGARSRVRLLSVSSMTGAEPRKSSDDTLLKLRHPLLGKFKIDGNYLTLLPRQLSAWVRFLATQFIVERRLNFNEFLEGSRAAFLRLNELIGREDVEELRPLLGNNVLKTIKESIEENAKVSNERPLLEILDMHQFIDNVDLQRSRESTKLWMLVDVCYAYTFKLHYNNRESSKVSESLAPDGVQERDSRMRFKALIADRNERDQEPMWQIVKIQS